MKTEISRNSHQPEKRYSGVYQQQGRMLTDADWNELVDILKDRLDDTLKDIIGSRKGSATGGTPRHRTLQINSANKDISPGHIYVDGVAASVQGDSDIAVTAQDDFPEASGLSENCKIYADVWERTVTSLMDNKLLDKGLHGADTSTRKQVLTQIKWCPSEINPENPAHNPSKGDAPATITLLQKTFLPDQCDPCMDQFDVESRIGNYLFRVEIHEAEKGESPTSLNRKITLKWSAENGAIQCGVKNTDPPDTFTKGKWAYEFFNDTSEKHLGVHLNDNDWKPVRGILKKDYSKPANSDPNEFVRRWDGFCTLIKSPDEETASGFKWEVDDEFDKDQVSSITFNNEDVTISLDAREIQIKLNNTLVAGDYWLAEVRESQHDAGTEVISNALPNGIEHHYLQLGAIKAGNLEKNPEADRKYKFPPLTEMTRMFIAGGDGQEVVPGDKLPQPLCVAVANGEWPVAGAKVRFQAVADDNSATPLSVKTTSSNGIAEYIWTPDTTIDAFLKIKVTLVDPTDQNKDLDHPPLYFHANLISADQVVYEKDCTDVGQNTIHSHLATDAEVTLELGDDGYYTVKEVLDVLLCSLKAKHIPYDEPTTCENDPSVKSLLTDLDINGDGFLTIKDVLDTLLCKLKAEHIPYNPTGKGVRWEDINEENNGGPAKPNTIQTAIDNIVENLESTDIRYKVPDCGEESPTVRSLLPDISNKADDATIKIDYLLDRFLCKFKATHLPVDNSKLCSRLSSLTGNEQVDTVQDAINALCRIEAGGGCCSITLSQDEDIIERLAREIVPGKDAKICFTVGKYRVKEPVRLEGLGSITVQGCGTGTVIEAVNGGPALIFNKCQNVSVQSLTIHNDNPNNPKNTTNDYLNGTLTIHNSTHVMVKDVTLRCPHNRNNRITSCLTVSHDKQTSSLRVRDCQLNPGDQQVGMLLVNVNEARIEDNLVQVRPHSPNSSLKKRIKNKKYRLSIRKMMITDIVVVTKDTPADPQRNVEFSYEGRLLRFKAPKALKKNWYSYLRNLNPVNNLSDRDLIRYIKDEFDRSLLLLATEKVTQKDAIARFKEWFETKKVHLPAIASQGIVTAGRVAKNICIIRNSIRGISQGIHIGLSDKDSTRKTTYAAGRLLIQANHIINYVSSQSKSQDLGKIHGVFVGNLDSLYLENNHMELQKFPYTLKTSINGVRAYGYFGRMIQIRGNHLNGFQTGIFVKALDSQVKPLWQVENNLLAGGSCAPVLEPQQKFITANNRN